VPGGKLYRLIVRRKVMVIQESQKLEPSALRLNCISLSASESCAELLAHMALNRSFPASKYSRTWSYQEARD
jgi:hypothetical protein